MAKRKKRTTREMEIEETVEETETEIETEMETETEIEETKMEIETEIEETIEIIETSETKFDKSIVEAFNLIANKQDKDYAVKFFVKEKEFSILGKTEDQAIEQAIKEIKKSMDHMDLYRIVKKYKEA